MSLVGGGSRSALWAQLLASALNLELQVHDGGAAGGALGAARLAWLADGGDEEAVCTVPATVARYTPKGRRTCAPGAAAGALPCPVCGHEGPVPALTLRPEVRGRRGGLPGRTGTFHTT